MVAFIQTTGRRAPAQQRSPAVRPGDRLSCADSSPARLNAQGASSPAKRRDSACEPSCLHARCWPTFLPCPQLPPWEWGPSCTCTPVASPRGPLPLPGTGVHLSKAGWCPTWPAHPSPGLGTKETWGYLRDQVERVTSLHRKPAPAPAAQDTCHRREPPNCLPKPHSPWEAASPGPRRGGQARVSQLVSSLASNHR